MVEINYNDYKQVGIGIARPMDYYNISLHDAGTRVHDHRIRAKYPHEWCDDNKTNIFICHNKGVILWKVLLEQNAQTPIECYSSEMTAERKELD